MTGAPASVAALAAELHAFVQLIDDDGSAEGSSPVAGWTVAVKDNMDVSGTVRTDGLSGPHPPAATEDAEVVRRLRAAGARIVAKANLEELSFGATTQNDAWGACRNPWDRGRIPGGSSGGSAVAVAAGLVRVAVGTDTGGSLRNPAAFCGVTTLRPSHGLVPTLGVTPLSPSMDVVGPMARSAAEVRAALDVMAGAAPRPRPRSLAELTVGVPEHYFLDDLEPEVAEGFRDLLGLLSAEGARIVSVTGLRDVERVHEAMAALQNSEAVRHLQPYWHDSRVSAGIRGRIEAGRGVTTEEIENALAVAFAWRGQVDSVLDDVDVVAVPATPFVAPVADQGDLTLVSRRINRFTGCWSLTGLPVLGLPVSPSSAGLPVGAQLVGRRGADWALLAAGEAIQAVSDWHGRRPPGALAAGVWS
ncbi:amidase [Jiangella muralis]|uniref:amidase n=1 Tax=Jiangella muralis TaxID=702383 RepID=UPI00069EC274|nr:amidase [Jiangella muralis]